MPLMPAPPMPTKWTRLTLCFIAQASRARCTRRRRVAPRRGARPCARPCAIASSDSRVHATRRSASRSRRELRLRNLHRRAGVDEKLRVGALLVGDRAGQRNDDRADADRGELGDRRRAAAADDEIGLGVARGDVVDERDALGVDAGVAVRGAQRVDVPLARLMDDVRPRRRRQERERLRHALVQAGGAEASADDEQRQRTRASGEAHFGRRHARERVAHADCRPIRLCAHGGPRTRREIRSRMRSAPYASTRFARPGDRILLVQHQRLRGGDAHQRAGERRESAEARARRPARGGG